MNKERKLVVFATSLSQAAFAGQILKNQYSDHEKLLVLADSSTYNMLPREDFLAEVSNQDAIFDRKIYLNALIGYKELSNKSNFIEIGNILEKQGVSLASISNLFIGLLSTRLYVEVTKLFFNADISLVFDGMMSFGPLRGDVFSEGLAKRIKHVYYEDLCSGVIPKYLPELSVTPEKIEVDYGTISTAGPKKILIALQSLSYSRIMSTEEEHAFYQKYISGIIRVFKDYEVFILPHPNNSSKIKDILNIRNVTWLDNSKPGEAYIQALNIGIVASVFSTLMFRASKMKAKCFSFGTDELLLKLSPYENSNRIPVILSRYCFPCFDEIPTIGSRQEFIEGIISYKANPEKIKDILAASSVLVKPSLKEVIDVDVDAVFESLAPFERGLILSGLPKSRLPEMFKNAMYPIKVGNQQEIQKTKEDSSHLLIKIKNLEAQLNSEKEKRERIKNSISWRITKPIRLVGALLNKK